MLINNFLAFIIGSCFGSFINVLVYRLPLQESILLPRSQCIICKYKIKWYENIPIVSWIFLRGKCRNCNQKISISYPLIEISTGLLFLLNNYSAPSRFSFESPAITLIYGWFFITILLTMAILDIKYLWLPDSICKVGILLAICLAIFIEIRYIEFSSYLFIAETILAALSGYLSFQFIKSIGFKIYNINS